MDWTAVALSVDITAIIFALITAYSKLVKVLENHAVRLNVIEQRLDRIEKKIDRINGCQ